MAMLWLTLLESLGTFVAVVAVVVCCCCCCLLLLFVHDGVVFCFLSRSTSLATILNRSISFGQLPLSAESAESSPPHGISTTQTPPPSSSHLSHSLSGSVASFALSTVARGCGEGEGELEVGVGGYLGRFVAGDQGEWLHQ